MKATKTVRRIAWLALRRLCFVPALAALAALAVSSKRKDHPRHSCKNIMLATPKEAAEARSETIEKSASLFPHVLALGSVIVAIISAVLYVFLRIAYLQFYGIFGLTPEEAGFGRLELVSQTMTGLAWIVRWNTRWGLALLILLYLAWRLLFRNEPAGLIVGTGLFVLLTLSVIQLVSSLVQESVDAGQSAINDGVGIESRFRYMGRLNIPALDLRALPVRLDWLAEEVPAVLAERPECLLLVGRSDERIHLFNIFTRELITVERADVVPRVQYSLPTALPEDCQPLEDQLRGTTR